MHTVVGAMIVNVCEWRIIEDASPQKASEFSADSDHLYAISDSCRTLPSMEAKTQGPSWSAGQPQIRIGHIEYTAFLTAVP